jgi:glycosyltransferase involved in cell wall biosynthesis
MQSLKFSDYFGNWENASLQQKEEEQQQRPFFFLSDFMYGGCLTFTAHLLHSLGKKLVFKISKKSHEKRTRDFGYGIEYQNVSLTVFDSIKYPFITDMYRHFDRLKKLKRNDVTIVIHDPGEISRHNEPYLKYWNIITIRKSMQNFLQENFGIESQFLYHPFYAYPISQFGQDHHKRKEAVSISRVDFQKNIEIMLEANKTAKNPIKVYGWINKRYVTEKLDLAEFSKYYQGKYDKSFSTISKILANSKFMVDLSSLPMDGGGTQYTFLDAINHNCAIILNRQWIENVDAQYCDFKEDYNCYAVSNAKELSDLLNSNIDTTRVVQNARRLLVRHTSIIDEWKKLALDNLQ